jgi:hypothetical protein
MVMVLFVGYICDKIKPWIVLSISNILVMTFTLMIIIDMYICGQNDFTALFDTGFIGSQSL